MAAIFQPSANLWIKVGLLATAAVLLGGMCWWFIWPRTDYVRRVGYIVDQPVPFSHEHHVSGLGIDCRFCHSAVEVGSNAGMPPTYTCMTCHAQIWANADLLAPVARSLAQNRPIEWALVNNLPDYVYFNHSIHIAKGVGCASCHGPVDRMPLISKAEGLTMQFCLDCHRDPGPNLRPADEIFNTAWQRDGSTPSPDELMKHYGVGGRRLDDCSICHR